MSVLSIRTRDTAATAEKHAPDVDREARFPVEAFEIARAQRLMGVMIPEDLGGEGARLSDVADVCYALGRACASTGMIYAMHQTKVACLVRHGRGTPWLDSFMRDICNKQLLLASSTTEGQGGGNIRSSAAAIEPDGDTISLERAATVISYGLEADGIVTTARRAADALDSDQVLVVFPKENYSLHPLQGWNTLGMRGTCSSGFTLKATGCPGQILQVPYAKIHEQTMMPTANLLWGSVWTGIATAAVERTRLFLRKAARQSEGRLPPGVNHFATATASLRTLRALMKDGLRHYESSAADEKAVSSIEFQTSMNILKVEASERAVSITLAAMRACGLSGYRNDGEFSISRHLRDALSSPIMINNDRILSSLIPSALLDSAPASMLN